MRIDTEPLHLDTNIYRARQKGRGRGEEDTGERPRGKGSRRETPESARVGAIRGMKGCEKDKN